MKLDKDPWATAMNAAQNEDNNTEKKSNNDAMNIDPNKIGTDVTDGENGEDEYDFENASNVGESDEPLWDEFGNIIKKDKGSKKVKVTNNGGKY